MRPPRAYPPGRMPPGRRPRRSIEMAEDEKPRENEVVRVVRLSKFYGTLQALRQVSFSAEYGDIYGLIGPNGAGKTTLLKILATLIYPNYGSAYVGGYPVSTGAKAIRRIIGYMPDTFGYYEELTVEEYLRFYAVLYHLKSHARNKLIPQVLEQTNLAFKADAVVSRLSRGMQQRLQVARVLLNDPEVLLLDEPASGLDPRARIDLKEIIRTLTQAGKTVIVSSHVLSDLDGFVNKLGIIERGRMLFTGSIQKLTYELAAERRYSAGLVADCERAAEELEALDAVSRATAENSSVVFTVKEGGPAASFFAKWLIDNGYKITHLDEKGLDLQEAFLMVTKGIVS